jgi:hypothetical protein
MSEPCTCPHCNAKQNRIAAYGAIRRAATVARQNDKAARHFAWEGDSQAYAFRMAAVNVRRAIRAAIRSAAA